MAAPTDRRKIRVTGKETLLDVANVVFKDRRLSTLIGDLNPSLPTSGPIAANVVVTCPSKVEALAFAKKMGFTLGFDEKAANGTNQRRAWQKLQGPASAGRGGILPAEAAQKLLGQKLPAPEVGKRLVKLCEAAALEQWLAGVEADAALHTVQRYVRLHLDYPRAKANIGNAVGLVEATLRPSGLYALLLAQTVDGDDTQALLASVLMPAPVRAAVADTAERVVRLVRRARELVKIERGARDVTLASDADGAILAQLCAALVDGVEPVSADRLKGLGLDEVWALASTHLLKLKEMLKKHEELLARAPPETISTLAAAGDGARLPKPWPVIASVVRGTRPLLERAPVSSRDSGLGGLITHRVASQHAASASGSINAVDAAPHSMEGGPVVSAASLLARAASGARNVDEASALAERLAPRVVDLLTLYKPLHGDAGPLAMRRARRKSHFTDVIIARGAPTGDAVARIVDELLADCVRTGVAGAERLQRPQLLAARDLARGLTDTISIHQKNASEAARAILVVAMALDRETGGQLLRPTGREAFKAQVVKHGGRVLSKASMVFAEPDAAALR